MPHSILQDPLSFPSWPASSKDAPAPRILPPPSSYHDSHAPLRQTFTFTSGPLTPPPTTQMNVNPARHLPMLQSTQRTEDMKYPIRAQVPATNQVAPLYPYNTSSAQSLSVQNSASTVRRSPPPSLSALVLPEPSESKKSPSVAAAMKLPDTIRAPQANLPQLAAEVTCLFWFENGITLKQIENMPPNPVSYPQLCPDSTPNIGFRKWVATLLSTTQVTQEVVLLALYFIYKLKSFNPTVKGRQGSEYRLLTVALMLGNKFLDDNTYTNKTWADVSGISVQEVHIMEVEFLSNMRYSLFTSDREWRKWQENLGKFGRFIAQPPRSPRPGTTRSGARNLEELINIASTQAPAALPSPPVSNNASPPFLLHNYSPSHASTNTPILLPTISSTAVSPIGPLPELDPRFSGKKRSYDENGQEPAAKRHAPSYTLPHLGTTASIQLPVSHHQQLPRVPLPTLSIPSVTHAQAPIQLAPQLPPPGGRAMAMVYPPPVQWSQQQVSAPTSVPPLQAMVLPQPNVTAYDQSRQLSPYPGHSANSSPVSATFTPSTSSRHSPSYFLSQRSSPYRPVRPVHSLLAPSVSGSMYNAPKMVTHDQMQYHPLGRPMNDRRVGHLPYMHHEAWPQTNQFNQWPELPPPPQPVFH